MRVLWSRGPATVLEIQKQLSEDLAESTIRTLLHILIDKGQVRRERVGRAFSYSALVDREEARRSTVSWLVDRLFGNPANLVLNVLEREDLSPQELARVQAALDRRRGEQ